MEGGMNYPPCPECGGENEFLGNEPQAGISWFRCKRSQRVYSMKLAEMPRFDYADTIKRAKDDDDSEGPQAESI
jgi:hypothetical protein